VEYPGKNESQRNHIFVLEEIKSLHRYVGHVGYCHMVAKNKASKEGSMHYIVAI